MKTYSLNKNQIFSNGTAKTDAISVQDWAQGFQVNITWERDSTYYQMFILIPMFLLDIIMLFVVFIPLDHDKRVDTCITCVLGYIFILIVMSNLIPRTHKIPIIVFQTVALLLLATFNTIMVVVILAFKEKAKKAKVHKQALKDLYENCKALEKIYKSKKNLDDKDALRYEEEWRCLDDDDKRKQGPTDRCNNFCKSLFFCFKSHKEKELDNELYDAYDKVKKDSPKAWLRWFGVINIGYWFLKIFFVNFCCIPCFWYPRRILVRNSQVSPQPQEVSSQAGPNDPKVNPNNPNPDNIIPTQTQPIEDDCLCCCSLQPKTKSYDKETVVEDFLCGCSFHSEEDLSMHQPKKNPNFSEECEKVLRDYHERSWNRIANKLNVCWVITSLFFLVGIIVITFIFWFGKSFNWLSNT